MTNSLTLLGAIGEYLNLWIQLPLLLILIAIIVFWVMYRRKNM